MSKYEDLDRLQKLKDAGRVERVDNGKDNVTFKIAE